MAKLPRKSLNALDDLVAQNAATAEAFLRQHRDVIDIVQKQAAKLQADGTFDAIGKLGRELEAMRSKITFPEDTFASFKALAGSLKLPTIDLEALTGGRLLAADVKALSSKVPASSFDELARIAAQVKIPAPPVLDPSLLKGWSGLEEVYERVASSAQKIAAEPRTITIADVEALVTNAAAMAAKAASEKRGDDAEVYLKALILWLLGLALEDKVKELLSTLLVVVQLTFAGPELPTPPTLPALREPPPVATQTLDWRSAGLPDIIKQAGPKASQRTIEFFAAEIRNPNTRQAYMRAVSKFLFWCEDRNVALEDITPFVVAAYIEDLGHDLAAPSVKQHLAAVRMYLDYLVLGQVIRMNPAASVRGPKHVVKRGKTPVLTADQARLLLDSIDTSDIIGLRDRALIGVMVYSFARVSATVGMRVEDYYPTGKRWWFRLHKKGGKRHEVPAHHNAEAYLGAYLEAAGIGDEKKGPLFRTVGRDRKLTTTQMHRVDVLRMIYRRAKSAGLDVHACCHTFRATGITAYLENGGTIEKAQRIAAHESPRTTKLYDRTKDELTLDEIERIVI